MKLVKKQFSLEIKSNPPFLEMTLFTANSQFFGIKKCHMSHSTFCYKLSFSHVLIEKVQFLSKLSYIISLKKKVLSVKWYLLSPIKVVF